MVDQLPIKPSRSVKFTGERGKARKTAYGGRDHRAVAETRDRLGKGPGGQACRKLGITEQIAGELLNGEPSIAARGG
jgi:hypothetical protein